MKIGIPMGLGTYECPILFTMFFEILGIEVVMSKNTDKEILEDGIENSLLESCLASKIFMGHVANLVKRSDKEEIDYIFIPRFCTFKNNDTTCVKFFALYDICKNIFDAKFLTLNIDYNKKKTELFSFINLGKKLGKNKVQVILAYLKAKKMQQVYDRKKYIKQEKSITEKSDKLKVLIVSHPYVLYDEMLGKKIIKSLNKNNVNTYFANVNSISSNQYLNISKSIYWKSSKALLNGLYSNLHNVDGIVYISVFPCGTDSLVNDIAMRKINTIPNLNIVLDEQNSDVGINTRLESFIDILSIRKEKSKESTKKSKVS